METIKVIELSNRIIFVDDILTIYKKDEWGEYQKLNTDYYIKTKYGNILVSYSDYKKVKEYLLSLNESIYEELPKEEKKIEKMEFCYEVSDKMQNANNERFKDFINEIIDKVNGE